MTKYNGQIAEVVFTTGKVGKYDQRYDFHCDLPVMKDQIVVVNTVTGPALATVTAIKDNSNYVLPHAWVLNIVDMSRVQAAQERAKKLARLQVLERAIDLRATRVQKHRSFVEMAITGPDEQLVDLVKEANVLYIDLDMHDKVRVTKWGK